MALSPTVPWPFPQVVVFKSDGTVLLNELQVKLPHVTGESWAGAQVGRGTVPLQHQTRLLKVAGLPSSPSPPSPLHLAASFSIFQPSSHHLIVNTAFGLRMQVQLVPVMQLFLTLDQAAQGRVQGEWPRLLTPQSPTQGLLRQALPNLVPRPLRPLWELQWPGGR